MEYTTKDDPGKIKHLKMLSESRFSDQLRILNLWQTLGENFYPERADFTVTHTLGEELGDGLADSNPILIRRELGNSFAAMLRNEEWFEMGLEEDPDHLGKMWLEFGSKRLLKLMRNRSSNFIRATKEGDHDYATFGQCVISVEANKHRNGLLYRNWHMRDCCWWDNDEGQVGGLIRRWNAKLHEAKEYFGLEALHPQVAKRCSTKPFDEIEIHHFDIPTEMYGDSEFSGKFEWVSCFLDVKNKHMIQVIPKPFKSYIVPRFQTIAGSPYAYSPATVVGLPDARTLQAMTHTLLEAGERHARPPIVATENVIRGDANLYADGVTFISEDYDQRSGSALAPLVQDAKGFPFGLEMRDGIVGVLARAFYIDQIDLPSGGGEMTAYEFSERMKQYRRRNLPLFAPLEHEYNGQLCELSFDLAMRHNMLGSPYDVPQSLRGKEVQFKFQSPLTESEEEAKVQMFSQVANMLAEVAPYDTDVSANINFDEALRDTVEGIGAPAKWMVELQQAQEKREAFAQQRQQMAEQEQAADPAAA